MKIIALILFISTLAACDSGGSDKSYEYSAFVIGDSLCEGVNAWPEIWAADTGILVDKHCIGGTGINASMVHAVPIADPEFVSYAASGYDVLLISLGINDALMGVPVEDFIASYRVMMAVHTNIVCVLPPITTDAYLPYTVSQYRKALEAICPAVVNPARSDMPDGIHYTAAAQKITADSVRLHNPIFQN